MSAATAGSVCGVGEALSSARLRLGQHSAAAREAELLLAHVLGQPRSFVRAHAGDALERSQQQMYAALIERRAQGEPVAYLTGCCGFWSFDLEVTPAVLIPRPETELLVEQALARIPEDAGWRIADLGTGSGAIALAIAHERPRCRIIATDISPAALEIARANAARLNLRNAEFRLSDWFSPMQDERFDMIVSNPPYVRDADPHLHDLRFEPDVALLAGTDGLQCLREIAARARGHFTRDGWLLLEHGYDQGRELLQILAQLGYERTQDYTDLAGIPRMTVAQWATPHGHL